MKYGLILDVVRDVQEYILGGNKVPYVRFNEKADWRDYPIPFERQVLKSGEDPQSCTVEAGLNQIEIQEKFLYGRANNYSSAFNYPRVPVIPERGGADPHVTFESFRRDGLVLEKDFPMPDTLEELKDITRQSKSLQAKGLYWTKVNDYKHESLWKYGRRPANYKDVIKDALTTCALSIAVDAWNFNGEVYVSDNNGKNTHLCVLLYVGDYLSYKDAYYVFDTYDSQYKWLHPDHDIQMAKRIWLNRRTKSASKSMIQLLQEVIKRLSMKPTLLDTVKKHLGTDVTPLDKVPDEIACTEVVTTILREVYPETPRWTGTYSLYDYFLKGNGWKRVDQPEPGDVVVSPTGLGNGIGHAGFVLEDNTIASNNSFGPHAGKITVNYTITSWLTKYGARQKMPVTFWRHV